MKGGEEKREEDYFEVRGVGRESGQGREMLGERFIEGENKRKRQGREG